MMCEVWCLKNTVFIQTSLIKVGRSNFEHRYELRARSGRSKARPWARYCSGKCGLFKIGYFRHCLCFDWFQSFFYHVQWTLFICLSCKNAFERKLIARRIYKQRALFLHREGRDSVELLRAVIRAIRGTLPTATQRVLFIAWTSLQTGVHSIQTSLPTVLQFVFRALLMESSALY